MPQPLRLLPAAMSILALGACPRANGADPPKGPVGGPAAAAAKPPAAKTEAPSPGEAAVRQAIEKYVAAMNAGDFKAVAAMWTPEGDLADSAGRLFQARKVIQEHFAKQFGGPERPKLSVDVTSVR